MAKVALVAHEVQTVLEGQGGGVAAFVTHFARLLRDAGEEVTLILTRQETFPVRVDEKWRRRYAEWGIELIELHSVERDPKNWCETWAAKLSEQLAPYLYDFDIAYFQDWANVAFHAARLKKMGLASRPGGTLDRMPVLVTVLHGPSGWIRTGNQQYPEIPGDMHLDYIERYSAEHSDLVVSPSRYLKNWADENGWRFGNEPQVLGLPYIPPPRVDATRPLASTTRIVFFGRMQTRKGVALFVAALRMLFRLDPSALLGVSSIVFLGGEQEAGTFARVRSELAETGIAVSHVGNFDSVQAAEYLTLHASDSLVVVPSPAENFPYAVIETSSIPGINLLCSRGGGIAEVFDGGNAEHMFEPYPLGLAKKIAERLRDPSRSETLLAYDADAANARWLRFHREALQIPTKEAAAKPGATVDVCIPYYNKAATLPQLLQSLERQTSQQFGVIAVNDGSTEEATAVFNALAEKYKERGWKFVSQENAFVDAARNRAASLSSADYLLFVDADDILAPNAIESMLRAITFSGDDCVVAGGLLFDSDDSPCDAETGELSAPALATYMPLGPDLACALVDPMVLGTSMIVVRRAAFEAIDGYRTVRGAAHEDWELQIRLVQAGFSVDVLPEFLLYFRKTQAGLSVTSDAYEAMRRLLDTYEASLTTVGLRGLATNVIALQKRCEKLEVALKTVQDSRTRLLNGLAKEMLRRKGMPTR
jgi:GT2 family glycosyltransferase/glycosyltransferase involved in cell wall biosynthesis